MPSTDFLDILCTRLTTIRIYLINEDPISSIATPIIPTIWIKALFTSNANWCSNLIIFVGTFTDFYSLPWILKFPFLLWNSTSWISTVNHLQECQWSGTKKINFLRTLQALLRKIYAHVKMKCASKTLQNLP